jgi:hypothetical protein
MSDIKLVSLMKARVILRMGGRYENEIIINPSGFEIHIQVDSRTVTLAGADKKAPIVYEYPTRARGIPTEINPWIRYIVPVVAYEMLADRKDFVTPSWPVKDRSGIIQAYRQLKGHEKQEVTRFFQEAGNFKSGELT